MSASPTSAARNVFIRSKSNSIALLPVAKRHKKRSRLSRADKSRRAQLNSLRIEQILHSHCGKELAAQRNCRAEMSERIRLRANVRLVDRREWPGVRCPQRSREAIAIEVEPSLER